MSFNPNANYHTVTDLNGTLFVVQNGIYYDRFGNSFATLPPSMQGYSPPTDSESTTPLADGESDTTLSTTAWTQTQIATANNPSAISQGIVLTSATSGSTGLLVSDNTNINFGTGNFTIDIVVSVQDWTTVNYLFDKLQFLGGVNYTGVRFQTSSQHLYFVIYRADAGVAFQSSTTFNLVANTANKFTVSVVRETATVSGSIAFYANGIPLGAPVTIPVNGATLTNTSTAALLGNNGTVGTLRNAGLIYSNYLYNRALSAADVLDLYRNDINFADKWGSQTAQNVSTCVNSGSFPYTTFSGASATGFTATSNGTGVQSAGTATELSIVQGKNYIVSFDLTLTSGTLPAIAIAPTFGGVTNGLSATAAIGHNVFTFTAATTATSLLEFTNSNTASSYAVSNLNIRSAGATFALTPEYLMTSGAIDSAYGLAITYPASAVLSREEMVNADQAQTIGGAKTFSNFIKNTSTTVTATNSLTTYTASTQDNYLTGTAGASFAITFPAASATIDGTYISIMSTASRASTTWTSSGATFVGAPSSLAANTPYKFKYNQATTAWYFTL